MTPEPTFDIERPRAELLGDGGDFAGGDEQSSAEGSTKRRISQGQAMRSIFGRARDPDNAPLMVAGRQVIRPNKQPGGPAPGIEAAFEIFGACASSTQPRGNALTE